MLYILGAVLYVGVGQFLASMTVGRGDLGDIDTEKVSGLYLLLWWLLWPLGLLFMLLDTAGVWTGRQLRTPTPEEEPIDYARINELERSLGMTAPETAAPRPFPTLPGARAEACLLPMKTELDFKRHYGWGTGPKENAPSLKRLTAAIEEVLRISSDFGAQAENIAGQELLDTAEATLRRISRVEETLEPLFAGLSYASYGRARNACLQARTAVGDVLDARALAGGL